jgi:dihydroceramidase
MPWAAVLELHGLYVPLLLSEKAHCLPRYSWHIFTGIGVYIFMGLVECLRSAQGRNKMGSAGLRLSSTGTWPFMVYLENTATRANTKKDI